MSPKWFQIIQALPGHPEIARGNLAVAFLVGAVRTSFDNLPTSPEIARQELSNLLTSFVDDTPKEYAISIIRCAHIGQPVVGLTPSGYAKGSSHGLDSVLQGRRTVLLDAEFATVHTSTSGLIEQLFQELGNAIRERKFSFRSGDFHYFNRVEIDFIEGSTSL
jgi:hypothetical protein